MALHSRDAVTFSAAVAMRSHAECSNMEGHTRLSTTLLPYNIRPVKYHDDPDILNNSNVFVLN